ncbi:MAG TPA: sigma-70 family RNA polymerase sigma factor [Polyangiaceae bacterium]|jgi:RNA polymerase sigma-70 factor (ECF subfamily)
MIDLDANLDAIRLGDTAAFGRFVAGAERGVRESLRSFAAHVDCEAIVQETFLRAWQVAPRVEPDGRPNALLRFTVRVARNLAISEVRRARAKDVDPATLAEMPEVSPPAPPDPFLRRAIEECRDKLPLKPARALAARIESAGAEPDEALAARLGMKTNTFLQNFSRARKMLGECLESKGVAL